MQPMQATKMPSLPAHHMSTAAAILWNTPSSLLQALWPLLAPRLPLPSGKAGCRTCPRAQPRNPGAPAAPGQPLEHPTKLRVTVVPSTHGRRVLHSGTVQEVVGKNWICSYKNQRLMPQRNLDNDGISADILDPKKPTPRLWHPWNGQAYAYYVTFHPLVYRFWHLIRNAARSVQEPAGAVTSWTQCGGLWRSAWCSATRTRAPSWIYWEPSTKQALVLLLGRHTKVLHMRDALYLGVGRVVLPSSRIHGYISRALPVQMVATKLGFL
ncbi:hypothetical protein LX36DRAFT_316338 [Colletotrichum falcatum]|nr:hypothetical protein LX36DRAFT_316338 [Colletotrichum falcatum]